MERFAPARRHGGSFLGYGLIAWTKRPGDEESVKKFPLAPAACETADVVRAARLMTPNHATEELGELELIG